MFEKVCNLFSQREPNVQAQLDELRRRAPVPMFWLFGKTQSGKTTLVRYLTGATDAEIGQGFRPCTRFSREYDFPTAATPLLRFLDTRGLDEADYDPTEELSRFNDQAHMVLVTVKALDHAQENVLNQMHTIRRAQPSRPVVLVLTCLHEAYPQQQHPTPYPFGTQAELTAVPEDLRRSLAEQTRRFAGLVDRVVPVDITPPAEGFQEPNYGGEALKSALLDVMPSAYRQTFLAAEEPGALADLYTRQFLPYILSYSVLALSAGAIPVPGVTLLILPTIQKRMVRHLAELHGQPFQAEHFTELAASLRLGNLVDKSLYELAKFIPYVGAVTGGARAYKTTASLGKAACFYYSKVQTGQPPLPEELRRYYQEQLALVEESWKKMH